VITSEPPPRGPRDGAEQSGVSKLHVPGCGSCPESLHCAARRRNLYLFKGNPLMKNLEGDPRYKAFLHKMNLPQ